MSNDILGMSDEDFLSQGESLLDETPAEEEHEPEEADQTSYEEEVDSGSEEEGELEPEDEAASLEPVEEPTEDSNEELEQSGEEVDNTSENASEEVSGDTDLQKVLQPFRANGKDVQVKNADEAITLMQLGANYTKKMQELAPNLKALKTLEKNELLDPDKLNYLIDLSKKDPKAIAQLIKDAEYEPNGFDDDDVEYTPNNHQVSDNAIQLEQVLESIESTPTYDKCIDLVGNQWDEKSKELLTQEPNYIAGLNEQMQNGIFDKISTEVERVKMFGGLSGLSDFEAYRTVGAQLMQHGELNAPTPKPVATTEVKPLDKAISKQRKAATAPRGTRKTAAKPKEGLLAMSDEDFLKINNIQL